MCFVAICYLWCLQEHFEWCSVQVPGTVRTPIEQQVAYVTYMLFDCTCTAHDKVRGTNRCSSDLRERCWCWSCQVFRYSWHFEMFSTFFKAFISENESAIGCVGKHLFQNRLGAGRNWTHRSPVYSKYSFGLVWPQVIYHQLFLTDGRSGRWANCAQKNVQA